MAETQALPDPSSTQFDFDGGPNFLIRKWTSVPDDGGLQMFPMTVPAGTAPGQTIRIRAPDGSGRLLQVTIPQGCPPGSSFLMQVPPAPARRRSRWRPRRRRGGGSAVGGGGGGSGSGSGSIWPLGGMVRRGGGGRSLRKRLSAALRGRIPRAATAGGGGGAPSGAADAAAGGGGGSEQAGATATATTTTTTTPPPQQQPPSAVASETPASSVLDESVLDEPVQSDGSVGCGYEDIRGNLSTIVAMLRDNSSISEVYLQNCHVGDDGAAALASAVRLNTKLRMLWIRECGVGDAGASRLADALRTNRTLEKLHLLGADIDREGASALAETLRYHNHTLGRLVFDGAGVEDLHDSIQECADLNSRHGPVEAEARKTGRFPRSCLATDAPLEGATVPLALERAARIGSLGVAFDLVREKCVDVTACAASSAEAVEGPLPVVSKRSVGKRGPKAA